MAEENQSSEQQSKTQDPSVKEPPKGDRPAESSRLADKAPGGSAAKIRQKVPWHVQAQRRGRKLAGDFGILSRGVVSRDTGTRRMSAVFFVSCVLMTTVVTIGVLRLKEEVDLSGADQQAKRIESFLQKHIENADQVAATLDLGKFTIDLRPENERRRTPGVVNLAELAITIHCDGRAACDFIRYNVERARDQITHVFVYTQRDELMSVEGKKRLKGSIIKQLNYILPKGKVVEVYFTKLLIS